MRFFAGTTQISDSIVYHMKEFWTGFAIIESSFKFDMIFLILLIPTIIGLFIVSQKGVRQSNTFLLLISSCLLISPLLSGFTHIVNGDYRIIPLIVFFSIGFGLVFVTKTDNNMSKRKFILSSAIFVVTLTLVMVSYVDVIFPHLFHRDFGAYL